LTPKPAPAYQFDVRLSNAFGASFSNREMTLRNALVFLDEPKIIYPIGKFVVTVQWSAAVANPR